MKFLIFTLLFSTQVFAIGNTYEDEMKKCVSLSREPEVCDMMGCKFVNVVDNNGEERSLCVSSDRIQYCIKKSSTQHRCQRAHCFYDFDRNVCYPHLFRFFDLNAIATTLPAE